MTIRNHFAAIVGSLRDARVVWVDALQHWMVFDPIEFRYKHDRGLAERVVTDYVMREFPDKLPGRFAREAMAYAKTDDTVARSFEDFDASSGLIGTPLGAIRIDTDELLDPSIAYPITMTVTQAPDIGYIDSRWEQFVGESMPDHAARQWLQMWAGSCLTGVSNQRCLVFVYGPGGTGKSIFVETLLHAFGDYGCIIPAEVLLGVRGSDGAYWKAVLKGKRMAVVNETGEGDYWNAPAAKSLTGGDTIHARNPYGRPFAFTPTHKLIVVSNDPPQLGKVDSAMRDRMAVLRFETRPTIRDTGLKATLRAEAGKVLGWALEGLYRLQDEFKGDLMAAMPVSIRAFTDEYLTDVDTVGEWLAESTETDWDCQMGHRPIYASYKAYVEGVGRKPKSWTNLRNDLIEREALRDVRTAKSRVYIGLRVQEVWQ